MIVVDTSFLVFLLDPESTQERDRFNDRVRYCIETLSGAGEEIVIPTPSLAELVAGRAKQVDELIGRIKGYRVFSIQPFDEVIAIETGDRIATALGQMEEPQRSAGWRVAMKFDAMIAATAIVWGARAVYTDDEGLGKYLLGSTTKVQLVKDLPLPPEDPQTRLPV